MMASKFSNIVAAALVMGALAGCHRQSQPLVGTWTLFTPFAKKTGTMSFASSTFSEQFPIGHAAHPFSASGSYEASVNEIVLHVQQSGGVAIPASMSASIIPGTVQVEWANEDLAYLTQNESGVQLVVAIGRNGAKPDMSKVYYSGDLASLERAQGAPSSPAISQPQATALALGAMGAAATSSGDSYQQPNTDQTQKYNEPQTRQQQADDQSDESSQTESTDDQPQQPESTQPAAPARQPQQPAARPTPQPPVQPPADQPVQPDSNDNSAQSDSGDEPAQPDSGDEPQGSDDSYSDGSNDTPVPDDSNSDDGD